MVFKWLLVACIAAEMQCECNCPIKDQLRHLRAGGKGGGKGKGGASASTNAVGHTETAEEALLHRIEDYY